MRDWAICIVTSYRKLEHRASARNESTADVTIPCAPRLRDRSGGTPHLSSGSKARSRLGDLRCSCLVQPPDTAGQTSRHIPLDRKLWVSLEGHDRPTYVRADRLSIAAIQQPDGSFETVTGVGAGSEYKMLMGRLTPDKTNAYRNRSIRLGSRSALETFRDGLGLPGVDYVGVLSNLIISLRRRTEESLGYSIGSATVTTSSLGRLDEHDIQAAMGYAGLTIRTPHDSMPALFHDASSHPNNPCQAADERRPWHVLLFISYTGNALATSLLTYPHRCHEPVVLHHSIDQRLGSRTMTEYPSEELYWDQVHHKIRGLPIMDVEDERHRHQRARRQRQWRQQRPSLRSCCWARARTGRRLSTS